MSKWPLYRGDGESRDWDIEGWPPAPPWRPHYSNEVPLNRTLPDSTETEVRSGKTRGEKFQAEAQEVDLVNAALFLRRPLLVTGKPGTGKSMLAYAVAHELQLGPVLRWSINTRSTLKEGLYHYDAIGRLQAVNLSKALGESIDGSEIGGYIRLGPLGTALLPDDRPRVLLIDEIDKSDIDLPNDLLNIFEEGEYLIPELYRLKHRHSEVLVSPDDGEDRVPIRSGRVRCRAFPVVIMTSNGEREFPPAFLRRCLRLDMKTPDLEKLLRIIRAQFGDELSGDSETSRLLSSFLEKREQSNWILAVDQLLNAIYLRKNDVPLYEGGEEKLLKAILHNLAE